jgi:hypothetical protein
MQIPIIFSNLLQNYYEKIILNYAKMSNNYFNNFFIKKKKHEISL